MSHRSDQAPVSSVYKKKDPLGLASRVPYTFTVMSPYRLWHSSTSAPSLSGRTDEADGESAHAKLR
eukprot:106407-Prymnesium_polylepis.1